MANYITKLQDENAQMKADFVAKDKLLSEFRAFLASSKFYNDPTIQVRDVDARLVEILYVAGEVEVKT